MLTDPANTKKAARPSIKKTNAASNTTAPSKKTNGRNAGGTLD